MKLVHGGGGGRQQSQMSFKLPDPEVDTELRKMREINTLKVIREVL